MSRRLVFSTFLECSQMSGAFSISCRSFANRRKFIFKNIEYCFAKKVINNGNSTEWSLTRSVISWTIYKDFAVAWALGSYQRDVDVAEVGVKRFPHRASFWQCFSFDLCICACALKSYRREVEVAKVKVKLFPHRFFYWQCLSFVLYISDSAT